MNFYDKYVHIGYSFPGVPKGWKKIVENTIIKIERAMWPWWLPMSVKRWIHLQATGGSVLMIRNKFWNDVRNVLTNGQKITDIKDKYAELRIYGYYGDEIHKIIEDAERLCEETCENCSSGIDVDVSNVCGWFRRYCKKCRYKFLANE